VQLNHWDPSSVYEQASGWVTAAWAVSQLGLSQQPTAKCILSYRYKTKDNQISVAANAQACIGLHYGQPYDPLRQLNRQEECRQKYAK
jgi:hypothetical protein